MLFFFSLPLLCDFFACPKKVIMRGLYFLCVVAKFQSVQELWATHGATESDKRLTFGRIWFLCPSIQSCKKKCSASPTFRNKTYGLKKKKKMRLFSVFEDSCLCECLATDVHTVKNLLVERGATVRRKQVNAWQSRTDWQADISLHLCCSSSLFNYATTYCSWLVSLRAIPSRSPGPPSSSAKT